ncbi:SRPBCC family protein [Halapricum desulfuricans]|uniref:Lipid binding protein n=1 Tax=Halapricum desulfuricans TaxID=2841257 RepID=A0A897NPL5_9EURY|nr:SRPBCC family protein [Halapricum desulfuricans]QSG14737.1 Lipid binding protein [Halapricum desulfuricans]
MATYKRSVRVEAPFEEVWEFHATGDGLVALTPGWMHLQIEAERGPDGESDPDTLEAGSTVVSTIQPFGVGPRQRWVSEIVARERKDDYAMFRDEMAEGPFPHWVHTHSFYRDGSATLVRDFVEYDLPGGPVGRVGSPLAWVGLEPMFRYRHRKTKELLERP